MTQMREHPRTAILDLWSGVPISDNIAEVLALVSDLVDAGAHSEPPYTVPNTLQILRAKLLELHPWLAHVPSRHTAAEVTAADVFRSVGSILVGQQEAT